MKSESRKEVLEIGLGFKTNRVLIYELMKMCFFIFFIQKNIS